MRKTVVGILVVVAIGLAAWVLSLNQKLGQSRADFATLQSEEQATSARYAAAIDEVAAIQESLQEIDLGEHGTQALETELAKEQNLSQDRGEQTMTRIAEIKAGVERANSRILELEEKLQQGDVKVAGLEKLIKGLRQTVSEKEQQIVALTTRVGELQTQVAGLETEVAAGNETIRRQDETIQQQTASLEQSRQRMGTIYYVVGTKKELSRQGLIESKGGLLGIGRTVRPTGRTEGGLFTALDTDRATYIPIDAEKAKVVSAQPVDSYALENNGEQLALRILDKEAFRAVKYVIVMKD
jgi:predicted  nucleic acid-binding Zn-ribbon protein